MFPAIDTPEQARAAVAACRYPPQGTRVPPSINPCQRIWPGYGPTTWPPSTTTCW
ncbi:MAG: hypothetical protein H6842_11895 [Rhodospirillaceae bacterium]|nr:hypothetical protein [Rhodospirillaceae bacterium]